jgi:hypothetical protein
MRTGNQRMLVVSTAIAAIAVFTLLLLEASLHVASRLSPTVGMILFPDRFGASLPDSDLVYRGNPRSPGNDANGFRNSHVPTEADVVAIGDSHTWGTSVASEESWSQVLGTLTSCDVYNMSLSGYGPLQYARLAEQAIKLRPRVIAIGIYFGNDLFDNWQMYLNHPNQYAVPEDLLRPAMQREREKPLARDVEEFFALGQTADEVKPAGLVQAARHALSRNSSLWAFARAIKSRLLTDHTTVLDNDFRTAAAALTPRQLEYASTFEGTDWRTIFTSRYREAVVNDDDPRIRVGYQLTESAVRRIDDVASRRGIKTIFVLIPTKESVFVPKVKEPAAHNYFVKLTEEEARYRHRLAAFMTGAGFNYVDMTPVLQASQTQPYFESADGHPNAVGHRVIAERLLNEIGRCN